MPKRASASTRQEDFRVPPGVSRQPEALPSGVASVCRHAELGLLGRLVLQGVPSEHGQVSCDVAGDLADPLTARRRTVLEPLTTALVQRLEAFSGTASGSPWETLPPNPPPPRRLVESKLMPCERCDAGSRC